MCKTQYGSVPKAFRSDRGGEYLGHDLRDHLKRQGIEFQHTMPYSPEQNGVAERKNRYLMEAVRSMLIDANLPNTYWGEAVMTATYLQNKLPTRIMQMTPYESWHNRKPNVNNLKVFGCRAFAHIPKQNRNKLQAKAHEYIFIGYPQASKGYRLLENSSGKIIASRDVRFILLEDSRAEGEVINPDEFFQEASSSTLHDTYNTPEEIVYLPSDGTYEPLKKSINNDAQLQASGEASVDHQNALDDTIDEVPLAERKRTQKPPSLKTIAFTYDEQETTDDAEPKTYEEAINGPNGEQWKEAIAEEINSLEINNTWDLEPIPRGKRVIGYKWVFKIKRNPDGTHEKYKARLVAKGFSQKYGVDYDEVFAPVVTATTIRMLLSIAGRKMYYVKHWDVKTAFLNGRLNEVIYMNQPPGCEDNNHADWGCRLNKCLYGLKQAARNWYKTLDQVLTKWGFTPSPEDPCLYKHGGRFLTYLVVHVDDILIASNWMP